MSQVHNLQDDPTLKILYLQSQVHCSQWESTSQTLILGSHVLSVQVDPSQPWTWGHISTVSRVTLLPRPFTWGHTSTVYRLTPPPPAPRPCTCGHRSTASRVTPPPIPYTWIYTSTVSMVSSTQTMHLQSHIHCLQGEPLPDPAPGVTNPQSPH